MSDVRVAGSATATAAATSPAGSSAALLLHGIDVAPSRRDSLRRRLLACADLLSLLLAYAVVWFVAPPPNAPVDDLPMLLALPCWIVLNKVLRLYDSDAALIHQSTLEELPRITH